MQVTRPTLALLLICSLAQAQNISLPPIPNLEPLAIYRDQNSWAHVFSTSDSAAYYGFGLAQMRDMPVTTARNLALASGELAMIFGPGSPGENGLPFHIGLDLRTQLWRIDDIAQRQKLMMPIDIRRLLGSYVAGVNAARLEWLLNASQLANNTEPLSFDLPTIVRLLSRTITLDDVIRHGVQMNGLNAMAVATTQAYSDDPKAKQSPIRRASNSFALGRNASTENVAMTIADPHLGFQNIGQLRAYFAQISGGLHDVCGISFPAMPAIGMGFNSHFSWAITSNNPDATDVWRAPTSGNGATFLFDGAQVPILRESVTIKVVDLSTGLISNQTHVRSYAGSYERPIVRENSNTSLSANTIWYAGSTFDTDTSLWEFFILLSRAHSVDDARSVFDLNVILSNNFLCADDQGNLCYFWSGRVPKRGKPTPGTDWSMIQDGTKSQYQWSQIHPAGDLPFEYMPAGSTSQIDDEKWLQCNVAADLVRPGTDLNLAKFPEYMVHAQTTPLSWRQLRGRELLATNEQMTGAELRAKAIDDQDLWWRAVKPFAQDVMDEFGLWQYPDAVAAFTRLDEWNGSTQPDRPEPLIQHLCWSYYARGLNDLKEKGQPAGSYDDFSFPEQVPTLATFQSRAWQVNRKVLATAIIQAGTTWRTCINPIFTQLSFPTSPWTPAPFQHLSSQEAVWGTAHYIDLTPFSSPTDVAAYPAPGGMTMLALGNTQILKPWETILENVTILGQTGTLVNLPIDGGAHTMLHVELHSGAPKAWFLEAIGPSEVADDPDRYRYVPDFVQGNWLPFPTKMGEIVPGALSAENLFFDTNTSIAP